MTIRLFMWHSKVSHVVLSSRILDWVLIRNLVSRAGINGACYIMSGIIAYIMWQSLSHNGVLPRLCIMIVFLYKWYWTVLLVDWLIIPSIWHHLYGGYSNVNSDTPISFSYRSKLLFCFIIGKVCVHYVIVIYF